MNNFSEKVNFIWSVADLMRGDFKQSEYGKLILPLNVLRRLDCVLEPTTLADDIRRRSYKWEIPAKYGNIQVRAAVAHSEGEHR